LDAVIVVNLASSEPPFTPAAAARDFEKLRRLLVRRNARPLATSSLYALAAIEAGCPYVNFTPSPGIDLPALEQRAVAQELPYMGRDGKTGETLVKSALAPMFAARGLEVLSWFGQNILGNRDGAVLKDAKTKISKVRAKDKTVTRIVGGTPATTVSIDFVPSLDDWKVAWDFIHFRGFLNTQMSMQFIWQGCDSILAAPLIVDLVRFAELEFRAGRAGPMRHLAFFFKDPMGVDDYDLAAQWQRLLGHFRGNGPLVRDRGRDREPL
jgi:myo-inositol-1-phosphate synthase